jgi:hypothetical protein
VSLSNFLVYLSEASASEVAYHALNGHLTPEEGQKYSKRADEANKDIEYLNSKKDLTPEEFQIRLQPNLFYFYLVLIYLFVPFQQYLVN